PVTVIFRRDTPRVRSYRSRPTKTADGIMRLAGTQRGGLADGAGHMSYAAIVIGHGEVERTSRYVGVRPVTIIWRRATRGGDVYRSRPTKTADGIMRLAGTQDGRRAHRNSSLRDTAFAIGHGEVERTSRYVGVRS